MFPCTCTDFGISKAGEVKEKEELKTLLKRGKLFFDVILDPEIFIQLKNKKYLLLIVNSRQFNVFIL